MAVIKIAIFSFLSGWMQLDLFYSYTWLTSIADLFKLLVAQVRRKWFDTYVSFDRTIFGQKCLFFFSGISSYIYRVPYSVPNYIPLARATPRYGKIPWSHSPQAVIRLRCATRNRRSGGLRQVFDSHHKRIEGYYIKTDEISWSAAQQDQQPHRAGSRRF